MAETFGDCNGGEKPTKWNTTILRRATDDELKQARSVLAPLENNHDCYRDGCNNTAGDGGETYHYLHRASSPDQQHQYHDPGSPLADNITTLVTGEDISTTSSSSTNQQTDNTDDQINLVCGEQMPASPLATPPSSPGQNFLDEKVEDCVKPTTTSTDTTSAAAITSEVNLSRCRKRSNSPTLQQQDFSPHSPPGSPPPSTTSPTSETPSGITIYRVAPGEEQEEESDNDEEEEELEDGELPAQTDDDDDDTTLEERASYNTKIK